MIVTLLSLALVAVVLLLIYKMHYHSERLLAAMLVSAVLVLLAILIGTS